DLEYLLGPLLLVAPVFDEGETRDVYLPAGAWWAWWDDTVHHGPAMIRVAAPLAQMPLFVRGGSLLPLAPALPHAEAEVWDPLLIEVRGRVAGTIHVSDCDGVVEARLVADEGRVSIELAPSRSALAVRLCGFPGIPSVALDEGTATEVHVADDRGVVVAVRAPVG